MNNKINPFLTGLLLLAAFFLWTWAVTVIDLQPIGPRDSVVGFASMNRLFHSFTGVHMWLYVVTDWLSLLPFTFMMGFAILGLVQWIRRKKIRKVDASILLLGLFYILVLAVYLYFEFHVINRRPVLINGYLEASYPSSTTMLVMCVIPTTVMQLKCRIRNPLLNRLTGVVLTVFGLFMVVGRLMSGVHWLSDIIGGGLVSAGLVTLYRAAWDLIRK